MNRYDRDWEQSEFESRRWGEVDDFRGGYDRELRRRRERPFFGPGGFRGSDEPGRWQAERPWQAGARGGFARYDRGVTGSSYPGFGGYPGGGRGRYYGSGSAREERGWGRDYGEQARGYDAGYGRGRGGGRYDAGYARQPFMPDAAYRRPPEYERPAHYEDEPWSERQRADRPLDDDELRDAVRESLARDSYLDAEALQVQVADGVVTLTGQVDDFLEARYAWDDAWETPGVRGVVNHLTVRTDAPQPTPATAPALPPATPARAAPSSQKGKRK